ncbi:Crp/Fnr family transcriptional regulator [Taibaiella sp. KBW10]|uniref:Crp/Fnr family transcriptional regulator n=1 Tax=Taibaiella sp. KBW10 TaxID=2153357 RepID=UPI000F5934DD|nr:Crp/Fnr family transcriptional regulator [Taibaiella sp. KBW10]RQO31448.1 Crp/Fnr family transcriptional regulator [Taibaiella sp. KBW10]
MSITAIIQKTYVLPDSALHKVERLAEHMLLPKGHLLLRADKIEHQMYFIEKGIVRAYANPDDTDITFWFGKEQDIIISMKSYVDGAAGYEHIELLEDCSLYRIHTSSLQQLFETDIHISNWGRKFAEQELIKTEERLISRQFKTAKERYQELLHNHPDLLQRVQLGHIASYLGITQVSLSRIRAEIK